MTINGKTVAENLQTTPTLDAIESQVPKCWTS